MYSVFVTIFPSILFLLASVLLFTCGKDSPTQPDAVPPPVATRIEITPAGVSLSSLGQSVELTSKVFDQNGSQMRGVEVAWTSGDLGVARVNKRLNNVGLVTAVGNGVTQITARLGSLSAEAKVTVSQVARRIEVIPGEETLRVVGAQIKLHASAMDARLNILKETPIITWSSSDTDVATVDATGLVTAVSDGWVHIEARSGNSAGVSRIVVALYSPDRTTLIAFYHSTGGPDWTNNSYWLSEHHSIDEWHGVVTNPEGRVVVLEPINNNLSGNIPPEIGLLDSLRFLNLLSNQLTGEIPAEIGQLASLEYLYLDYNRLAGEIPPEIGQLGSLRELKLSSNQLKGAIPPEIGQLASLKLLELSLNELTDPIPPEIGNLKNLHVLLLTRNMISGKIPSEIGQMEALQILDLRKNSRLIGPIPHALLDLQNLEQLLLTDTSLCAPRNEQFDEFLRLLTVALVPRCEPPTG